MFVTDAIERRGRAMHTHSVPKVAPISCTTGSPMDDRSGESAILATFAHGANALFATEVQAAIAPAIPPATFDVALAQLVCDRRVVVVTNAAPDPHLADVDLRIVAPATPAAAAAIEAAWRDFLREFLSSHRCS